MPKTLKDLWGKSKNGLPKKRKMQAPDSQHEPKKPKNQVQQKFWWIIRHDFVSLEVERETTPLLCKANLAEPIESCKAINGVKVKDARSFISKNGNWLEIGTAASRGKRAKVIYVLKLKMAEIVTFDNSSFIRFPALQQQLLSMLQVSIFLNKKLKLWHTLT